jgi:hypothetical protein
MSPFGTPIPKISRKSRTIIFLRKRPGLTIVSFFPGVPDSRKKIKIELYAWIYTDYRTLGKAVLLYRYQKTAVERVYIFARTTIQKVFFARRNGIA